MGPDRGGREGGELAVDQLDEDRAGPVAAGLGALEPAIHLGKGLTDLVLDAVYLDVADRIGDGHQRLGQLITLEAVDGQTAALCRQRGQAGGVGLLHISLGTMSFFERTA